MSNEVYAVCEAKCFYETVPKDGIVEYINTILNTMSVRSIYVGTAEPSGGNDGDVYIQIL